MEKKAEVLVAFGFRIDGKVVSLPLPGIEFDKGCFGEWFGGNSAEGRKGVVLVSVQKFKVIDASSLIGGDDEFHSFATASHHEAHLRRLVGDPGIPNRTKTLLPGVIWFAFLPGGTEAIKFIGQRALVNVGVFFAREFMGVGKIIMRRTFC